MPSLFASDETVPLDVRTGIVPSTATASRDFRVKQNRAGTNFRETMARAELSVLADALDEIGAEVATFLARG